MSEDFKELLRAVTVQKFNEQVDQLTEAEVRQVTKDLYGSYLAYKDFALLYYTKWLQATSLSLNLDGYKNEE